jgi:hypothetical protein
MDQVRDTQPGLDREYVPGGRKRNAMDAEIDMLSLDLAHSLALTELIRFALIEIASNDDRAAFRNRLRKRSIVTSLGRLPGRRNLKARQPRSL